MASKKPAPRSGAAAGMENQDVTVQVILRCRCVYMDGTLRGMLHDCRIVAGIAFPVAALQFFNRLPAATRNL